MVTLNITNSPITVNSLNNTETGRIKTHDISSQIANNNFVFNLNPQPVQETLIVTLNGQVLAPSTQTVQKDYTLTAANQITLHFSENLVSGSVLLAMYEEV